ncbi:baculoviral IAP repeat-containing protein 1-like [Pseudophryne corroboree]|uniref:baculoviral IAP repeat-containing protein 1-like n=1 Tax=Pseudophryne corroboree TaxID=495146 RepID=UPI0030812276
MTTPRDTEASKDGSKTFLKLVSWNVEGLNTPIKRKKASKPVLRGQIISYVAARKRQLRERMTEASNQVASTYSQLLADPSETNRKLYKDTKSIYDTLCAEQAKLFLSFQSNKYFRWGNRPGKLLANMVKSHTTPKYISSIRDTDGPPSTTQDQISDTFLTFFEKLYTAPPDNPMAGMDFLTQANLPTLSESDRDLLTSPVTAAELELTIKSLPNGKSPGPDGTRDTVQCFSCGGCLGNWEEDDDPWKEHAKWFPECSFLRIKKTRDEIEQYISSYCGFGGVMGSSFTDVLNKPLLSTIETINGATEFLEMLETLNKQLIERYQDPTFYKVSPTADSVSIDLTSLFADISVALKDTRNHIVRQLTLPDILSELRDITMIEGEAGSGKTALLRKIAILWASGRCPVLGRFSIVFYISLSSTDSQHSLSDIICQQLMGSTTSLTEETMGDIIKQLKQKVLFLLDDYGLMDSTVGSIEELLKKNPWNRVSLAVTVSTDKGWKLRQNARSILSIQKFPLMSTIYLVKNLFSHDSDRIDAFILKLQTSKNLTDILQSPLAICAHCSYWIQYPSDNTISDIHPFKAFLKYNQVKFPNESQVVDSLVSSCGELALKGLFKHQFHFTEHDLRAAGVESDKAIKFGLLSKFTAQRLQPIYTFFNPSFQEFLAGKRLSELLECKKQEDLDNGYHYLHQINSFLKIIGQYSYFLRYASRISTKATTKILTYLFSLYDRPEALDCHLDSREHLQQHPELEIDEDYFILILRKHIPIDIDYVLMHLLMTFAVEVATESQCLPECAPIIMQFLAGKTFGFSVSMINNNSAEAILSFIEKYPESISLLSSMTINIDAKKQLLPPDYSNLERAVERHGAPTVENEYASAYQSLNKIKQDNEKRKNYCDQVYSNFPDKIVIRDSIVHPFMSLGGHKVPVFKIEVSAVDSNNFSQVDWKKFQILFSISDRIELLMTDCRDFVKHIGPAIEQFSNSFKTISICDSYLTTEEQDLILKMSSLECLCIGCNEGANYPERLIRGIHNFPCLSEITIYLLQNPEVVDHMPDEFERLGRMKKIAFGCTGFNSGSVKFVRFIQNFAELEFLHLSFKYYPDFNGLMNSLTTCKKLKELSFFGSVLLENNMALLAAAMKNFTSLRSLNLDRHSIFGTDIAECFATALGFLTHLEKLWLPVGEGMAHAARLIIEQFQHLPNLQFLKMTQILDDESIALLGEMAREGCLKRICNLELNSNDNVSESGWTTFFETAGNMPELNLLNIIRFYTNSINSHATTVTAFVRFVSRLPSLTTIWLLGWLLDKDDLNMFNTMKENHPQSKSLEIIWQMPLPFEANIEK